jgi:hypothetical protein
MWGDRYKVQPSFVLGFHGCDVSVGESILSGKSAHITTSENAYDWLGSGVYFWEGSPQRALEFAQEAVRSKHLTRGTIKNPFVLGAIIDLGICCNLVDSAALGELATAHQGLMQAVQNSGSAMPENKGSERGARFLDRAVIEFMHAWRLEAALPAYDTVRAAFIEGPERRSVVLHVPCVSSTSAAPPPAIRHASFVPQIERQPSIRQPALPIVR